MNEAMESASTGHCVGWKRAQPVIRHPAYVTTPCPGSRVQRCVVEGAARFRPAAGFGYSVS